MKMSKYSQDVVKMLYEHQSEYISGQYIANQLNISRTAVKKVIDRLKQMDVILTQLIIKDISNASPNRWYRGIINKNTRV